MVFIFALLIFFIFELLFLNGVNTMKHGRKFHFGIIYLFKFILFKIWKKLQIFQGFFQILNSKLWSFKCTILNYLILIFLVIFSIFELKIRVFDEVCSYLTLQFVAVFPGWSLCKKNHIDSICLFDVIVHWNLEKPPDSDIF